MVNHIFIQILTYRRLYQELIVRLQSTTSSSADIQLPNRIERSSTDILKVSKIIYYYFIYIFFSHIYVSKNNFYFYNNMFLHIYIL